MGRQRGDFDAGGARRHNNAEPGQHRVWSVFDPIAATVGIAVIGSSGTKSGTWTYSTDGGMTWTAMPAVSAKNALLLSGNDLIEFVPNAGFLGTVTLMMDAWNGGGRYARQHGEPGDAHRERRLDELQCDDVDGDGAGQQFAGAGFVSDECMRREGASVSLGDEKGVVTSARQNKANSGCLHCISWVRHLQLRMCPGSLTHLLLHRCGSLPPPTEKRKSCHNGQSSFWEGVRGPFLIFHHFHVPLSSVRGQPDRA